MDINTLTRNLLTCMRRAAIEVGIDTKIAKYEDMAPLVKSVTPYSEYVKKEATKEEMAEEKALCGFTQTISEAMGYDDTIAPAEVGFVENSGASLVKRNELDICIDEPFPSSLPERSVTVEEIRMLGTENIQDDPVRKSVSDVNMVVLRGSILHNEVLTVGAKLPSSYVHYNLKEVLGKIHGQQSLSRYKEDMTRRQLNFNPKPVGLDVYHYSKRFPGCLACYYNGLTITLYNCEDFRRHGDVVTPRDYKLNNPHDHSVHCKRPNHSCLVFNHSYTFTSMTEDVTRWINLIKYCGHDSSTNGLFVGSMSLLYHLDDSLHDRSKFSKLILNHGTENKIRDCFNSLKQVFHQYLDEVSHVKVNGALFECSRLERVRPIKSKLLYFLPLEGFMRGMRESNIEADCFDGKRNVFGSYYKSSSLHGTYTVQNLVKSCVKMDAEHFDNRSPQSVETFNPHHGPMDKCAQEHCVFVIPDSNYEMIEEEIIPFNGRWGYFQKVIGFCNESVKSKHYVNIGLDIIKFNNIKSVMGEQAIRGKHMQHYRTIYGNTDYIACYIKSPNLDLGAWFIFLASVPLIGLRLLVDEENLVRSTVSQNVIYGSEFVTAEFLSLLRRFLNDHQGKIVHRSLLVRHMPIESFDKVEENIVKIRNEKQNVTNSPKRNNDYMDISENVDFILDYDVNNNNNSDTTSLLKRRKVKSCENEEENTND